MDSFMVPAWEKWQLHTNADGTIKGMWSTNDDEDRGFETRYAEMKVEFQSFEEMKERTGLSHVGCSGITVEVFLDGEKI